MSGKDLLGALGALTLFTAAQDIQAQTLSSIIGAGPVASGGLVLPNLISSNLVFFNFSETGTLPASSININFTSNGIEFTSGWTTITPGYDSSIIQFDVATTGGTITGTTLDMSGTTIVGNASASVGETITDLATNNIYSLQVFDGGAGNPNNSLSSSTTFNPAVTHIHIVKSIDVAAAANGMASLNFVENVFTGPATGVTPPVPEPMSLALIPLALAGVALRKKFVR